MSVTIMIDDSVYPGESPEDRGNLSSLQPYLLPHLPFLPRQPHSLVLPPLLPPAPHLPLLRLLPPHLFLHLPRLLPLPLRLLLPHLLPSAIEELADQRHADLLLLQVTGLIPGSPLTVILQTQVSDKRLEARQQTGSVVTQMNKVALDKSGLNGLACNLH